MDGKAVALCNNDRIACAKLKAALSPEQIVNKRKPKALKPVVRATRSRYLATSDIEMSAEIRAGPFFGWSVFFGCAITLRMACSVRYRMAGERQPSGLARTRSGD